MAKYNSEREFVTAYLKDMKENGEWVYKLPDLWFTLKPFDVISIKEWVPYAIEFKYGNVNTYEKIYKMLRPNQIWWLKKFQDAGWKSMVIGWDTKEEKIYSYEYNFEWKNAKEL